MYEPDRDIADILWPVLQIDLAGHGVYSVEGETEAVVLEAIDGLTIDKRDPRLRGPHLRWVRYGGAIVRVAAIDGDLFLLVAHGSSLSPKLGFAWGKTYRQAIGFRWVQRDALELLDVFDWPLSAPVVDDAFRRAIKTHAYLRGAAGTLRIVEESSDAWTLEGAVLVLKGDRAFAGEHASIVRYRGQLVRIARELPSHVLAVAHPSLGNELGFASTINEVSIQWLARSEIEVTALVGQPRSNVPAELMPLARRGRITVAGSNVPDGFRVRDEAPDSISIEHEDPVERPDLVALGFTHRALLQRTTHMYVQTVAKTDPRLGGFDGLVEYAGYRLRVIEREGDRAFVVASELCAHLLEILRDGETASGWVLDRGDAAPRPPLDEAAIAGLAIYNHAYYVPLGRTLRVHAESSDTLTLGFTSYAGQDDELIAAGFGCERAECVESYDPVVTWEHTLAVGKQVALISGPFDRWVRYRGQPMRAVRDDGDHVLLVAHPAFGKPLGFAVVQPDGAIVDVSCRWVRRDECEAV